MSEPSIRIDPLWFSHEEDPKERAVIKEILQSSQKELDIVRNLVYNIYITSLSFSEKDFNNPSWAYKESFNLGQKALLEKLLKLLDIHKEDDLLLSKTKRKALTDATTRKI